MSAGPAKTSTRHLKEFREPEVVQKLSATKTSRGRQRSKSRVDARRETERPPSEGQRWSEGQRRDDEQKRSPSRKCKYCAKIHEFTQRDLSCLFVLENL